ncbi:ATP-dependent DNA helicase DDX31 [Halictus rubicundus]|uniref:ATP-dependent DNA helicase DDX31 n=1 Tax=Halictus rubicundus TaxID=77578 RepID=UPI004036FCC5
MTVQDMDISLNISAEPAAHKSKGNNDDSIISLMRAQKNKTQKVKVISNIQVKPKSANTVSVGPKKRIKQKSLSVIVAKKLKGNASQSLKGNKVKKKVTFNLSPGEIQQKKSSQKVDKAPSNVGSKDKEANKSSSNNDSETYKAPEISFTKVTKENFGKTILARKRPIKDTDSKKTLSSIFSKQQDSKSTKLNLLGPLRKVDTDEDVVLKKKPKLEEPKESSSTTEKIGSKIKKKLIEPKKSASTIDKEKKTKKKRLETFTDKSHTHEKGPNASHRSTGKISSLFGHNPEIPNIGQRLVKPINEPVFTGTTFTDLNVHPFTISNLEQNMNITEMTIVQQKAIPRIFSGKDILIRSQTGSGKTLTYALPIVEFLHKIRPKLNRNSGLKALIVVPTRELALQTYECFLKLIKPFTWIVPGYLAGGEKRKAEKARLRKGCNILVGTPGRLLDHIQRTEALKLGAVKYFVLDEADRMFDMGYEKDISGIVSALKVSTPSENTDYDALKMLRQNVKKVFTEEEVEAIDQEPDKTQKTQNDSEPEDNANKAANQRQEYHSSSEDGSDDDEPFVKSQKLDEKKIAPTDENDQEKNEGAVDQSRRQTILLSATLTQAVEKLAGLAMERPIFVDAAKDNLKLTGDETSDLNEDLVVPQSVMQTYIVIPPKLRMVTLSAYIAGKCQSHGQHKVLIFMATQDMVDYHTEILSSVLGKPVDDEDEDSDPLVDVEFFRLHGSMAQKERTDVFKTFREARSGVLLCTDVAARGLDLPRVDTVVQYTGPISARDYVHRIGRTARAGSSGSATIFLTPAEIEFVRMLESRRIRIKQESMDDVLGKLLTPLCKHNSAHGAAIALQNEFESLVLEESKLRGKAIKAYISWVRFYSSYPRDMREVFNRKDLHLGHYAKSFALRETPQRIGGIGKKLREKEGNSKQQQHKNRLTNERPDGVSTKRQHQQQQQQQQPRSGSLKNVRMLNTSEYGSGLEPVKKPKKS